MKKTKVLLILVCAVLLVAASVMGTLAYLTSTDEVQNTFTVGQVHIELDEAKVGDNGKALIGNSAARVKENSYNLMPGHTYDKDPTVTVRNGSEESYIKMVVTVNKADELDKIFKDHSLDFGLETVVTGYDDTKWELQGEGGEKDDAGNRTYTFYYYQTVSAKDGDVKLEPLFKNIKIPGNLTNDEMKTLQYKHTVEAGKIVWGDEEKLSISVKAYAIQADGFDDADTAWDYFPTT